MESWIYLWMVSVLFRNLSANLASPPSHTVHHTQVSFDQAMRDCSPGVLTTLATEQEVADILRLLSKSVSPLNHNFTFWVGLRKVKDECVDPTLPLRGFKWTEDGSEESQVSRWTEEPKQTCTTVRCAVLKGEFDGSTVTRWGLISVSCKSNYQFICKLSPGTPKDRGTGAKLATPEAKPAASETKPAAPATPEAKPATPATLETKPATQEAKPAAAEPPKPEPKHPTRGPEPPKPEPKHPTRGPEPETALKPKLQGPDPDPDSEQVPGSDLCQTPFIPGSRSLSLHPENSSRIQVECWSTVKLEFHCSGHPAMWRLLDDSPANFSTICQCGGVPCSHTCLNIEGSYRCVCSDENGNHHDEDSPACKDMATNGDNILLLGILIPVLVTLVVLVVVVAVTVKCCLMRRSKKRTMKMVMKRKDGKDTLETANEKVA